MNGYARLNYDFMCVRVLLRQLAFLDVCTVLAYACISVGSVDVLDDIPVRTNELGFQTCHFSQGFVKAYLNRVSIEFAALNYYQESRLKLAWELEVLSGNPVTADFYS